MWGEVDGEHPFGVDVLVRIGSDPSNLVIRKHLRHLRTDFADPICVPRHDDIGQERQR
jgi:hypothetical protein